MQGRAYWEASRKHCSARMYGGEGNTMHQDQDETFLCAVVKSRLLKIAMAQELLLGAFYSTLRLGLEFQVCRRR